MAGRDRYKVNQWYDVLDRRGRGSKQQQSPNDGDSVIKFFVSNLPPWCSSADVVKVLKEYGDLQGTYIARKYDRLGKRFGFASFKNVRNRMDLEGKMKDVWLGSYKLFIIPARFVDGVDMKKKVDSVWKPVIKNDTVINDMHADIGVDSRVNGSGSNGIGMRTFWDTLMNKEPEPGLLEVNVEPNTQAFGEWFDCGLIGRVMFLSVLTDLRRILRNLSHVQINIRYVGGCTSFSCLTVVRISVRFWTGRNYDVFSILDEWKGQVLEVERLAWFKIHGVPLSISCPKLFDDIAGKFGEVIQSAQFSEDGGSWGMDPGLSG
ncbi:putative RNA recognition motif domain, nucleotide-binding alpha-beta plait domain superfamily [Helianthus annuus]|nr:putative RNA recognition motif domain, nucleotide-binding alpha-beta plait domain superfamily [Helianthus annuus]KAJ0921604.1 putative RNA recognition motif domain, nucleotide-binding alpha-beta plait domain superfamily [Helianthus annuus]